MNLENPLESSIFRESALSERAIPPRGAALLVSLLEPAVSFLEGTSAALDELLSGSMEELRSACVENEILHQDDSRQTLAVLSLTSVSRPFAAELLTDLEEVLTVIDKLQDSGKNDSDAALHEKLSVASARFKELQEQVEGLIEELRPEQEGH